MPIIMTLDIMLKKRGMSSRELAEAIGTTQAYLSRIKCGQIHGVRFSTLSAICIVLKCKPGDILDFIEDDELIDDATDWD